MPIARQWRGLVDGVGRFLAQSVGVDRHEHGRALEERTGLHFRAAEQTGHGASHPVARTFKDEVPIQVVGGESDRRIDASARVCILDDPAERLHHRSWTVAQVATRNQLAECNKGLVVDQPTPQTGIIERIADATPDAAHELYSIRVIQTQRRAMLLHALHHVVRLLTQHALGGAGRHEHHHAERQPPSRGASANDCRRELAHRLHHVAQRLGSGPRRVTNVEVFLQFIDDEHKPLLARLEHALPTAPREVDEGLRIDRRAHTRVVVVDGNRQRRAVRSDGVAHERVQAGRHFIDARVDHRRDHHDAGRLALAHQMQRR